MDDSIFKLQLLARSEFALTQIHARRTAVRGAYFAVVMALALLALAMLNFSIYLALAQTMTPSNAALIVALGNALIALIVFLVGRRAGPSENEEKMARDIREMAYREVSQDVDEVKARLEDVAEEVGRIGENLTKATGLLRFALGLLKKE